VQNPYERCRRPCGYRCRPHRSRDGHGPYPAHVPGGPAVRPDQSPLQRRSAPGALASSRILATIAALDRPYLSSALVSLYCRGCRMGFAFYLLYLNRFIYLHFTDICFYLHFTYYTYLPIFYRFYIALTIKAPGHALFLIFLIFQYHGLFMLFIFTNSVLERIRVFYICYYINLVCKHTRRWAPRHSAWIPSRPWTATPVYWLTARDAGRSGWQCYGHIFFPFYVGPPPLGG